jgi:predicted GIY-YIG superfamily endonuclease
MAALEGLWPNSPARGDAPPRTTPAPEAGRGGAPNYVYYCYADDGRLLYVGLTYNPSSRMSHHRGRTPWWPRVASVRFEEFATRREAVNHEASEIARLEPPHNKAPGGQGHDAYYMDRDTIYVNDAGTL